MPSVQGRDAPATGSEGTLCRSRPDGCGMMGVKNANSDSAGLPRGAEWSLCSCWASRPEVPGTRLWVRAGAEPRARAGHRA